MSATDRKDLEEDLLEQEGVELQDAAPTTEEQQDAAPTKRGWVMGLLGKTLNDDDLEGSAREMLADIHISGKWLKKHWSLLLIVFVCLMLFVTNRYQAQMEIIEEARLKKELNDWKYIWLTQFGNLTRSTRQSYIEESLKERGDSTLKCSKDAPFVIRVGENE